MQKFANISLQDIDVTSLNDLRNFRTKLLDHSNPYVNDLENVNSEELLEHLRKHLAVKNTKSMDPTERLAKILAYIPSDEQLIGNNNVNLRLLILKIVFRQHDYPGDSICKLNYEKRLEAVNKLKRKICLHQDWDFEVNKICDFLEYKHLRLAYEEMQKILDITYRESSYTRTQRAELYSLQIINCINIIEFIHRNNTEEFAEIYNTAFKTLLASLNKLKKLPEPNSSNCMFFAWNMFKSATNYKVVPVTETEYSYTAPSMRPR